jgi:hypothetical protein
MHSKAFKMSKFIELQDQENTWSFKPNLQTKVSNVCIIQKAKLQTLNFKLQMLFHRTPWKSLGSNSVAVKHIMIFHNV